MTGPDREEGRTPVSKSQSQYRFDEAEALLSELQASVAAGEVNQQKGFEDLLQQRPDLSSELRELSVLCGMVNNALAADAERQAERTARVKAMLDELSGAALVSDRYAVETELDRGGMGAVLRVVDRKLRRPLAMKVIVGQATAERSGGTPPVEPHQLARFLHEAQLTSQLDHPGIPPVHDAGVDSKGRAYFTMKLVRGQTLATVFEKQAAGDPEWAMPRVLNVIERVCEAMAFAHERGVIHRDLKPTNVMVGSFGEVYVMDWGLARRLGEVEDSGEASGAADAEARNRESLTRDGAAPGTPAYMSPEQARGEFAQMGPQSDVYALGAMLHQLITGTPPYVRKGEKTSGPELLLRILSGAPRRLDAPKTPPELVAICEKAIAYSPIDRYATMRDLALDLKRFVSGRTVMAFDTSTWAQVTKWVKRNRTLAASVAGLALAIVLGTTLTLLYAQEAVHARGELAHKAHVVEETNKELFALSAMQALDELETRAVDLWPPYPSKVPEMMQWMDEARALIDGEAPTDIDRDRRPSLQEHKAALAKLREKARPRSAEQQALDRQLLPESSALRDLSSQVAWLECMLGRAPWPPMQTGESSILKSAPSSDASLLLLYTGALVRRIMGGRDFTHYYDARVLCERLLALDLKGQDLADALVLHAWALYCCGRLDQAREYMSSAMQHASGESRRKMLLGSKKLDNSIARWREVSLRSKQEQYVNSKKEEVRRLERVLAERRAYEFDDERDRWYHARLSELIASLDAFQDKSTGLLTGTSERHGWGVESRIAFALSVEERSISGPEAVDRWAQAAKGIRESKAYESLEIAPQLGLVPLGPDPISGLWEFAHLASGSPAVRGHDGRLTVEDDTGVVLILIPGGTCSVGTDRTDVGARQDELAEDDERPVQNVRLAPFFMSKYEMTQGQWMRLTGTDPSNFPYDSVNVCGVVGLSNPVENVSWNECNIVLSRSGLELPTEAQWEYACRGGADDPWWWGGDPREAKGKVNFADETAQDVWLTLPDPRVTFGITDGFDVHCPVGAFPPNPYGLHEVSGNVAEWCRDEYGEYIHPARDGDGERSVAFSVAHVYRGGSFMNGLSRARSAARGRQSAGDHSGRIGVRPSLTLRAAVVR